MKYKSLSKFNLENKSGLKKKVFKFLNKILTMIVLCLVCLIVMEYSPKFKTFINEKVFNNNLSFAKLDSWYKKYLGDILPNNDNNTTPVFNEKLNYQNKEKYFNGYKLTVNNNYLVPIIENGIVVYKGLKDEYGNVIIVEQIDGVNVWYGNIKDNDIKLYDYIEKGKFLGETVNDTLYLVLEKEGTYLDIETYLS